MEAKQAQKNIPIACVGCLRFQKHGKNCWYFWELKKHCTMWTSDVDELAKGDIMV
mgnify:CR=1 FL=1